MSSSGRHCSRRLRDDYTSSITKTMPSQIALQNSYMKTPTTCQRHIGPTHHPFTIITHSFQNQHGNNNNNNPFCLAIIVTQTTRFLHVDVLSLPTCLFLRSLGPNAPQSPCQCTAYARDLLSCYLRQCSLSSFNTPFVLCPLSSTLVLCPVSVVRWRWG